MLKLNNPYKIKIALDKPLQGGVNTNDGMVRYEGYTGKVIQVTDLITNTNAEERYRSVAKMIIHPNDPYSFDIVFYVELPQSENIKQRGEIVLKDCQSTHAVTFFKNHIATPVLQNGDVVFRYDKIKILV